MSSLDDPPPSFNPSYDQLNRVDPNTLHLAIVAHTKKDTNNHRDISPSPRSSITLPSDLPIRRRPALGQSRTSPYPYPYLSPQTNNDMQSNIIRPTPKPGPGSKISRPRPGLNRTYSFCPSSFGDTYASASRSSSPGPSPTGPGRLSKPLQRLASGEVLAPSMERSMSSLGIDGSWLKGSGGSTPGTPARDMNMDENMVIMNEKRSGSDNFQSQDSIRSQATLQIAMPVPMITIDSPGMTSRPITQMPSAAVPLLSTSTPGFEYETDADWTAGPYTPDTPAPVSDLAEYVVFKKQKMWSMGKD